MVIDLLEFVLSRDLLELSGNLLRELRRLFRQLLLHLEQVPVGSHAAEHLVEEVVEVLAQILSNRDDLAT